jgi:hypothetical protein
MKRVSLVECSRGRADGEDSAESEHDQVILNVVGGAISFVVPSSVPDHKVTQEQYLERLVNCTLQLENGAQLLLWINADAHGVQVQVEPARTYERRGKARPALVRHARAVG